MNALHGGPTETLRNRLLLARVSGFEPLDSCVEQFGGPLPVERARGHGVKSSLARVSLGAFSRLFRGETAQSRT